MSLPDPSFASPAIRPAPQPETLGTVGKIASGKERDAEPTTDEGFSFWDLLDVINPLQHIPVVSSIYRELTGDTIDAPARMAGGALFGGVFGFAAAAANSVLEAETGEDLGGHMMAFFDAAPQAAPLRAAESGPRPSPFLAQRAALAMARTMALTDDHAA